MNVVVITGNLTRDPELRSLPSGTSVCKLRVAVNSRRKDQSGEWVDKPNYFDVTVWGAQGENCATYLSKGRPVAVEGRLDWREWEAQDGTKRQSVEIIANSVQFLGSRDGAGGGGQRHHAALRRPGRHLGLRELRAGGRRLVGRRHPLLERRDPTRGRLLAGAPAIMPRSRAAPMDGRRACEGMTAGERQARASLMARRQPTSIAAPGRTRRRARRPRGADRFRPRKYTRINVEQIDYKDLGTLRRFISDRGKVRSRRVTGPLAPPPAAARARRQARPRDRAAPLRRRALGAGTRWRRRSSSRTSRASARPARPSTSRPATCATTCCRASSPSRRPTASLEEARAAGRPPSAPPSEAAERAEETAALLSKTVLTIQHRAGEDGKLYGSVTSKEIAEAIAEARGLRVDRKKIRLDDPIREIGTYMVEVEVAGGRPRADQDDRRRREVAGAAAERFRASLRERASRRCAPCDLLATGAGTGRIRRRGPSN